MNSGQFGVFILILFDCLIVFLFGFLEAEKCLKRKTASYILQCTLILHFLPELFRNTMRAALGCAVWSGFQVARIVVAVVNIEQAALA